METENDEIEALKRELAALKTAIAPASGSDREADEWRQQMHALHEARMSNAGAFSASDLRAMEAATPTAVIRDIVRHGGISEPSGAGEGGEVTSAHAPK
jgi:hypothetical protein